MTVIFTIAGVMFTIAALLTVYRIVRGPSILDRMIASDVLLTTLILVVGAEMVLNGHTRTIPLMVVLAATAIFATIAVARYVSKQDRVGTATVAGGDVPGDGPLESRHPEKKAAWDSPLEEDRLAEEYGTTEEEDEAR